MAKRIKHPEHIKIRTVERYKNGETVRALSRELGVSEPCIYKWIQEARPGYTAAQSTAALVKENAALRTKLFNLMVKHNDFL